MKLCLHLWFVISYPKTTLEEWMLAKQVNAEDHEHLAFRILEKMHDNKIH